MRASLNRRAVWAFFAALLPLSALAQPVITNDFAFTERRGASSVFASSHTFVLGATSITPSGAGTTAFATHVPSGSGPDYALPFVTSPLFPDQYATRQAYAGQTGQWDIAATDAGGTTVRRTHMLDDVRDLPLITGLTISGPALTPHLSWNAVDPAMFPSFCGGLNGACAVGFDIFRYQVEVRLITGTPGNPTPLSFTFAPMPISVGATLNPAPTMFDIPVGVLSPGNDYLIGIRLNQNEIETILPNGTFVTALENRSTAYFAAPIPEPEIYAMLLAGLTLLGIAARRRAKKEAAAT